MGKLETEFAEIGARLEALRVGMGIRTQAEWAERDGFNVTQLNNWIKGVRRIPVEHAETLCNRYGVTLDWVYRGRLDGLSENARKVL
jgi:transcriptional regulator with XRE-family HTH domain